MPTPPSRLAGASPWTVITQGGAIAYDAASLLDKLEYVLRAVPAAVPRTLAADGTAGAAAAALARVATEFTKVEVLARAAVLWACVVDFVVDGGERERRVEGVCKGLGRGFVGGFVGHVGSGGSREAGSVFAGGVGRFLGCKGVKEAAAAAGVGAEVFEGQCAEFAERVCALLAGICEEAHEEGVEEGEDAADVMSIAPSVDGAMSVSASTIGLGNGFSKVGGGSVTGEAASLVSGPGVSAGGNMGYIPTVSGIVADMPVGGAAMTTASDEHLMKVLAGLSAFMSRADNRVAFCAAPPATSAPSMAPTGPAALTALLDRDIRLPVQATYQAVFCLWLLSFPSLGGVEGDTQRAGEVEEDVGGITKGVIAAAMDASGAPRRLTSVLREVHAEKVVRISLATLRNLMLMSPLLRKEMVGAGLVAALESLCFRRWNDDDITEDLRVLADALEVELASMSTFDVYRAEVLSGALEWTPAHRDDEFWRENVEKMDSNNLEVLRCLVRLLNESSDPKVLAVACHDLSQFVKFHPRGRYILQSLHVKSRLMELMTVGEAEVRGHALNAVQVLMISNWNVMQQVS